ncbi:MAG: primosomal protein N', partial [Armatimonadetes bacterium]|nr:primosomal protein N' [Armatimonadota bacterium]
MYANVIVDIEGMSAPGPLTYAVPEALQAAIAIGSYVQVPLGNRQVLGYVVELPPRYEGVARPLSALLHPEPVVNRALLEFAAWMSRRYHASLAETLRCIVPEGLATRLRTLVSLTAVADPEAAAASLARRSASLAALVRLLAARGPIDTRALREQWPGKDLAAALTRLRARGWLKEERRLQSRPVRAREVIAYQATLPAEALAAAAADRERRAPAQARALRLFLEHPQPLPQREAVRLGAPAEALRTLAREGILQAERVTVRRTPWRGSGSSPTAPPPLTQAQTEAIAAIRETLAAGQHDTVLLHGVTASGKTEVYLHAIETVLDQGREAIVLLPEISLTAQVVEVFRGRFGEGVALLHSRLSAGERYDEWQRIRGGEARVVVGPRSALFAPCRRPGLIIMDEEHEPSYKQENSPRYHARQAALERARAEDAVLLLGSATPSVESYTLARQGEYRLVSMPERIPGRTLPTVRVVDLRAGGSIGTPAILSPELREAIADRLQRGEQTILFLNRRGFASFLLCRDCGYTARCPHCSVSLTLHAADRSLRCHHCNHRRPAPATCPQCQGDRLRPFGLGTERVEAEVQACFPTARLLRMDRDTTAAKDAHVRLYRAFRSKEAEILIGTQMVAKGLDFPGVTLVGVVAADAGLNVPDFRAAERTFQLLTQVAGRAGRGDRPGEVLIQTFNPEHYAIVAASQHDFEAFYAREVDFRRELGYPPFGALVNLLATDVDPAAAEARAGRAA